MATAIWSEGQPPLAIQATDVETLWAKVEAQVSRPVVLAVTAGDAQIAAVVGEPGGSVVMYQPPGYTATGTGSLHSVGDAVAAARDEWEPPVTAFDLGHHSEFPRWSLVPRNAGIRAVAEFCQRPEVPPAAVEWRPD